MSLTIVSGTIVGEDGTPQANVSISATLNAIDPVIATPDGTSMQLLLNKTSTVSTNASGYWQISVYPNSAVVEPKYSTYTFQFTMPVTLPALQPYYAYANTVVPHGAAFSHQVVVPAVSGCDFSTLV